MMYSLREIFTRVTAAGAFSFAVILLFLVLAPSRQASLNDPALPSAASSGSTGQPPVSRGP